MYIAHIFVKIAHLFLIEFVPLALGSSCMKSTGYYTWPIQNF